MIIYNKYINGQDHTWYDSSNVIYSKCYDNSEQFKTLKIVFKTGRTYLYKDVDVNDYIFFKNAESSGKSVNTFIIKKYQGIRITDTNTEKLNELKENFINEDTTNGNTELTNLIYHMDICQKNGEFALKLNDKTIYTGVEGEVSILNLLKSMNIKYSLNEVDKIEKETDEHEDKLILE